MEDESQSLPNASFVAAGGNAGSKFPDFDPAQACVQGINKAAVCTAGQLPNYQRVKGTELARGAGARLYTGRRRLAAFSIFNSTELRFGANLFHCFVLQSLCASTNLKQKHVTVDKCNI